MIMPLLYEYSFQKTSSILARIARLKDSKFLSRIAEKQPGLFVHWRAGMMGSFV